MNTNISIDKIKKILTGETALLAITPVLSIAASYIFEAGHASYFQYPFQLIKIDTQNTVVSFLIIISVLSLFYYYIQPFMNFSRSAKSRLQILIGIVIMFAIFWFPLLLVTGSIAVYAFAIASLSALGFIYVLTSIKNFKDSEAESSNNDQELIDILGPCLWLMFVFFGCGRLLAYSKENFHVFETNNEKYALVAVYGELAIGVKAEDNKIRVGEIITSDLNLEYRRFEKVKLEVSKMPEDSRSLLHLFR